MERFGDIIVNSKIEQELYSVAPEVTVASALETAAAFLDTADGLVDRAEQAIDSPAPETRMKFMTNLTRSAQLRSYATGIMGLCATEIVEKMTNPEANA